MSAQWAKNIVATQLILPSGHSLRPVDHGAAAASGHTRLQVARKPKVAILPTGTELVPIGSEVRRGDIIEYNSLVLAGQVALWGGEAARFPIIRDDFEAILAAVRVAAEAFDLILLNAGSSAGAEDYSARVIAACGQVLVHGVAVRPGHPVIIGMVERKDGRRIPIFGVPGYPVSATLTGEIFVEPLLARWTGRLPALPIEIEAEITRKVTSPAGDDDYLRWWLVSEHACWRRRWPEARELSLTGTRGCITVLPRGTHGVEQAPELRSVYTAPGRNRANHFCRRSHDLTLDYWHKHLAQEDAGWFRRMLAAWRLYCHPAEGGAPGRLPPLDPANARITCSDSTYLPGEQIKLFGG